jgi:hypothetical protein
MGNCRREKQWRPRKTIYLVKELWRRRRIKEIKKSLPFLGDFDSFIPLPLRPSFLPSHLLTPSSCCAKPESFTSNLYL